MVGKIKKELEAAKARGEKQFFANVPCRKFGHNGNRFTASGQCVECDRLRYKTKSSVRIEQMKVWREANPEKMKAAMNRWKAENPDACRTLAFKRRDRVRSGGDGFTAQQVDALYLAQGKRCANCLKKITKYHADHIVPLALNGRHEIGNIQILCQPCNSRKHKKDPIRWANENGRLL